MNGTSNLQWKLAQLWALLMAVVHGSTATLSNELTASGLNVCQRTVTFIETFTQSYPEKIRVREMTYCLAIPPRCTKWVDKYQVAYRMADRLASKDVFECCAGYIQQGKECVPLCEAGCVNGTCAAPSHCLCSPGWRGNSCNSRCSEGTWGSNCAQVCYCDNGGFCDVETGKCTCTSGYSGALCQYTCPTGSFGPRCSQQCACVHGQGTCDHVTGRCLCQAGYTGPLCEGICPDGSHGKDCNSKCMCQNGGSCGSVDGSCDCPSGWMGAVCALPCDPGYFGKGCDHQCVCYNGASCFHTNGSCHCPTGFTGLQCEKACGFGLYGTNCSATCNCTHDQFRQCDHVTGRCTCRPGFYGERCELTECVTPGRYGHDCSDKCLCALNQSLCDSRDGSCLCYPGFTGATCHQKCPAGLYGANCSMECQCSSKEECHYIAGCVALPIIYSGTQLAHSNGLSTSVTIVVVLCSLVLLVVVVLLIAAYYRRRYLRLKRTADRVVQYSVVRRNIEGDSTDSDQPLSKRHHLGAEDDGSHLGACAPPPYSCQDPHFTDLPPPYSTADREEAGERAEVLEGLENEMNQGRCEKSAHL